MENRILWTTNSISCALFFQQVVELLNQASLENSGAAKVILLKQVQELILHKEPTLLDNFFDVSLH